MVDIIERRRLRFPTGARIHVFDIDISLSTIVRQRYSGSLNFIGRRRPSVVEDYAIEGRVEGKARAEDGPGLLVYLSGYDDSEFENIQYDDDARSPCFISTDKIDEYSRTARIYIRNVLFRRLVEFQSTKRIDRVELTIGLNESRQRVETRAFGPIKFSIFDAPSHPNFRNARCHLLSVHASLGGRSPEPPLQTNIDSLIG